MAAKVSRIEREDRVAARAALGRLRESLREARHRHKRALFDARERCRAERLAVRERLRALRIRVMSELRETTQMERLAAREACALRMRDARGLREDTARARATVAAERKFQADLRHAARAHHARKKRVDTACHECTTQSDEEVVANLPSDLAAVYDRVKHELPKAAKGKPGTSKVEAFLHYAEKHPEKVLEATQHPDHVELKALEAEHTDAKRRLNPYEAKKARRVERMKSRAERLKGASASALERARSISDRIPMGQPILVGHHSERKHRRDIARIDDGHRKALDLHRQAETLERRARFAESNRAISSDDPDAVPKLREKLADLEKGQARMVEANKAVRSGNPKPALAALGFSEKDIGELLKPDPMGRIGFPSYALSNNAHEMGRVRKRIEVLEERAKGPKKTAVVGDGVRIEEAENRVRIVFDAKPAAYLRTKLKAAGFRWAPSVGAWQRHASWAAWEEAKRITGAKDGQTASDAAPTVASVPASNVVAFPETPEAAAERRRRQGEAESGRLKELAKKHEASVLAAKGTAKLDTTDIAALIRKDIKAAVARSDLPKAHYSVVTDKYSMGSSITVKASKLPFPVLNPDAFVVLAEDNFTSLDSRHQTRLTRRAEEVHDKLEAIVNAYHWNKSDPMSDVYNERFARSVSVESAPGEYEAIERAKVDEARRRRGY